MSKNRATHVAAVYDRRHTLPCSNRAKTVFAQSETMSIVDFTFSARPFACFGSLSACFESAVFFAVVNPLTHNFLGWESELAVDVWCGII